jgi:CoA:oxalate CoA-transferase
MSNGPLSGVTVIDMTRALAGPFATLLLAGMGARVIRIEQPGQGEGRTSAPFFGKDGASLVRSEGDVSFAHVIRHRDKESITLNLKHPEAMKIYADLIRRADVVVENFARGTADRLGVGYEQARAANPSIIYCSISGYGHKGGSDGKVMDGIAQALAGIMMTSGKPEDPPVRLGVPFADLTSPLFGVIGILAALRHRDKTGEGQQVDVSMLGVMSALQAMEPFKVLEDLGVSMRTGDSVPRLAPFGVYHAKDGYLVIASFGDRNVRKIFNAMDMPELVEDARFNTQPARLANYQALDAIVNAWLGDRTMAEGIARLEEFDVMVAPVRTPDEANHDPRVLRRREIVPLEHPEFGQVGDFRGPGLPITFSKTQVGFSNRTATLGEHNDAVYGDFLGYSDAEIERLRKSEVI